MIESTNYHSLTQEGKQLAAKILGIDTRGVSRFELDFGPTDDTGQVVLHGWLICLAILRKCPLKPLSESPWLGGVVS